MLCGISFSFLPVFSAWIMLHVAGSHVPRGAPDEDEPKVVKEDGTMEDGTLQILKAGYYFPKRKDIALKLYIQVRNGGRFALHNVEARKHRCCLVDRIGSGHVDCSYMDLIPDRISKLKPEQTEILTLLYPTWYPYDRVGKCDIRIYFRNGYHIDHSISFNTTLFLSSLKLRESGYMKAGTNCDTVDLDRLKNCEPVYCSHKYSGSRNYFDLKTRRCQMARECTLPKNEIDTSFVFDIKNNMCRRLNVHLVFQDLQFFEGSARPFDLHHSETSPTMCVNGREERVEGSVRCTCDPGWRSIIKSKRKPNPMTGIVYLCSEPDIAGLIKDSFHAPKEKSPLLIVSNIFAILAATFSLCLCCICMTHVSSIAPPENKRSSIFSRFSRPRAARVISPNLRPGKDDLDVNFGDVITNIHRSGGYWIGTCGKQQGRFEQSNVEFIRGSVQENGDLFQKTSGRTLRELDGPCVTESKFCDSTPQMTDKSFMKRCNSNSSTDTFSS